MEDLFISKERKVSAINGTGVQYIPGHFEPLVDLIIDKYLPKNRGGILDLGGGGLRFAIPVASLNKKITVVDLDRSSLNIELIFSRMRINGLTDYSDLGVLKNNILPVVDDVFHFLETAKTSFSLITAFRLIHFFNEKETDSFFRLVSRRLKKGGIIVISAFTQYDNDNATCNEIFINSEPVSENLFYRKFSGNCITEKIRGEQNLSPLVHLFSEDYLKSYLKKYNLKMVSGSLPSTRIVRGYIFIK